MEALFKVKVEQVRIARYLGKVRRIGRSMGRRSDWKKAYVTLKEGQTASDDMKKILTGHVRSVIGPIATPDKLQFAPGLPKTRSGKIMRRILRKIAHNELDALGDTSTLADPSVVDSLVKGKL